MSSGKKNKPSGAFERGLERFRTRWDATKAFGGNERDRAEETSSGMTGRVRGEGTTSVWSVDAQTGIGLGHKAVRYGNVVDSSGDHAEEEIDFAEMGFDDLLEVSRLDVAAVPVGGFADDEPEAVMDDVREEVDEDFKKETAKLSTGMRLDLAYRVIGSRESYPGHLVSEFAPVILQDPISVDQAGLAVIAIKAKEGLKTDKNLERIPPAFTFLISSVADRVSYFLVDKDRADVCIEGLHAGNPDIKAMKLGPQIYLTEYPGGIAVTGAGKLPVQHFSIKDHAKRKVAVDLDLQTLAAGIDQQGHVGDLKEGALTKRRRKIDVNRFRGQKPFIGVVDLGRAASRDVSAFRKAVERFEEMTEGIGADMYLDETFGRTVLVFAQPGMDNPLAVTGELNKYLDFCRTAGFPRAGALLVDDKLSCVANGANGVTTFAGDYLKKLKSWRAEPGVVHVDADVASRGSKESVRRPELHVKFSEEADGRGFFKLEKFASSEDFLAAAQIEGFVGREEDLKLLGSMMDKETANMKVVAVYAGAGIGKSSLIFKLLYDRREAKKAALAEKLRLNPEASVELADLPRVAMIDVSRPESAQNIDEFKESLGMLVRGCEEILPVFARMSGLSDEDKEMGRYAEGGVRLLKRFKEGSFDIYAGRKIDPETGDVVEEGDNMRRFDTACYAVTKFVDVTVGLDLVGDDRDAARARKYENSNTDKAGDLMARFLDTLFSGDHAFSNTVLVTPERSDKQHFTGLYGEVSRADMPLLKVVDDYRATHRDETLSIKLGDLRMRDASGAAAPELHEYVAKNVVHVEGYRMDDATAANFIVACQSFLSGGKGFMEESAAIAFNILKNFTDSLKRGDGERPDAYVEFVDGKTFKIDDTRLRRIQADIESGKLKNEGERLYDNLVANSTATERKTLYVFHCLRGMNVQFVGMAAAEIAALIGMDQGEFLKVYAEMASKSKRDVMAPGATLSMNNRWQSAFASYLESHKDEFQGLAGQVLDLMYSKRDAGGPAAGMISSRRALDLAKLVNDQRRMGAHAVPAAMEYMKVYEYGNAHDTADMAVRGFPEGDARHWVGRSVRLSALIKRRHYGTDEAEKKKADYALAESEAEALMEKLDVLPDRYVMDAMETVLEFYRMKRSLGKQSEIWESLDEYEGVIEKMENWMKARVAKGGVGPALDAWKSVVAVHRGYLGHSRAFNSGRSKFAGKARAFLVGKQAGVLDERMEGGEVVDMTADVNGILREFLPALGVREELYAATLQEYWKDAYEEMEGRVPSAVCAEIVEYLIDNNPEIGAVLKRSIVITYYQKANGMAKGIKEALDVALKGQGSLKLREEEINILRGKALGLQGAIAFDYIQYLTGFDNDKLALSLAADVSERPRALRSLNGMLMLARKRFDEVVAIADRMGRLDSSDFNAMINAMAARLYDPVDVSVADLESMFLAITEASGNVDIATARDGRANLAAPTVHGAIARPGVFSADTELGRLSSRVLEYCTVREEGDDIYALFNYTEIMVGLAANELHKEEGCESREVAIERLHECFDFLKKCAPDVIDAGYGSYYYVLVMKYLFIAEEFGISVDRADLFRVTGTKVFEGEDSPRVYDLVKDKESYLAHFDPRDDDFEAYKRFREGIYYVGSLKDYVRGMGDLYTIGHRQLSYEVLSK